MRTGETRPPLRGQSRGLGRLAGRAPLELGGGQRRAIVAPPRLREHVAELRAQGGGAPEIAADRGELVERDPERVERLNVLREAVDDGLGLGGKRPEQAIPDDEDAAVVLVEVAGV